MKRCYLNSVPIYLGIGEPTKLLSCFCSFTVVSICVLMLSPGIAQPLCFDMICRNAAG